MFLISSFLKDLSKRPRHAFQFRDCDPMELVDWYNGRAGLVRDFRLIRINLPSEPGLVVDCTRAWECLIERAYDLVTNYTDRSLNPSDLIVGWLRY